MKTIAIAAGVGLIAAVGAGVVWLRPEPMVAACEEAVVDRLKVPSSYDKISAEYDIAEATAEEAAGDIAYPDDPVFVRMHNDRMELYAKGAWRHRVELEYEAKNALGVPLRRRITCAYYSTSPKIERPFASVWVDLEGVD